MEWSLSAQKILDRLVETVPESFQEQIKEGSRREAERFAAEKNINFVEGREAIAGFILATPAHHREELKERLERGGIDWHKYSELFRQ